MDAQLETLIQQAQSGDSDAVSVLYRQWVGKIYGYMVVRVGGTADAQDLTQQVCLKMMAHLATYRHQSSFSTWIYMIARNTLIDFYRRKKFSSLPDDLAVPTGTDWEDLEAVTEIKRQRVQQIMEQLPDNYRQILEYRFLRGLSVQDTAEALGITQANVKVITLRALRKARSL